MENGIIGILTGILFILTISEFTDSCNMKFNIKKIFKEGNVRKFSKM